MRRLRDTRGQALVLMLGVVAALTVGALVLFALGQALGAKSREQRAADLSAVSAAAAMRRVYQRLFEPAFLPPVRPGSPRCRTRATSLARSTWRSHAGPRCGRRAGTGRRSPRPT